MRAGCMAGLGVALCLVAVSVVMAADTPTIRHKFFALDFWKGKLIYIDENDPSRDWEMPCKPSVTDMQLIGGNRILLSADDGFKIYSLETKKVVESFSNTNLNTVMSVRRLKDGTTLVGAGKKQGSAVYVLDATNGVVKTVLLPKIGGLRMMRQTAQGTVLLGDGGGLFEVTLADGVADDARVVRYIKLPRGGAFMGLKKPDGNYLAGSSYGHKLYEFKPDGSLVRELEAAQPAGMTNRFYAGIQVLKNGNMVQVNWIGHSDQDLTPGWQLLEFDKDGQLVWHWYDPKKAGSLHLVMVVDDLDVTAFNTDVSGILGP